MKKFLSTLLILSLMSGCFPLTSCQNGDNTNPNPAATHLEIVTNSQTNFKIITPQEQNTSDLLSSAGLNLRIAFISATSAKIQRVLDTTSENDCEILVGNTNRQESIDAVKELGQNEFVIKVVGSKLVICGANHFGTFRAVEYFCENILSEGTSFTLESDFVYKGTADFSYSTTHQMSYAKMGDVVLKAFANTYIASNGDITDTDFWDAAEILEAFLDAYERTGENSYLQYAEKIALVHFGGKSVAANWSSNPYNDDIAWACIAFLRLYNITGTQRYLSIAKNNFDIMWGRAYSQDLGGGLWWKDDERNCKNSCIQCPASIAACLLGKATSDDSYYQKAVMLMDWEVKTLFNEKTGQVYDSIGTNNDVWEAVFSYNIGTFVGACTLLHEKYGDEKYMTYASKAVECAQTKLDNRAGVLNGENSGYDGIGFKGILTRWVYKYAVYVNDFDVLHWMQKNADAAFKNRNSQNIIWTVWSDKTPEGYLDPFSASSALALLFNCEPWW